MSADLTIANPRLWWPAGEGPQDRYLLRVRLVESGAKEPILIDEKSLRIGLRKVRLRRDPLPDGEGFTFEINGRPIFCGGANWIPADSFLPRVDAARYRALLTAARDGNMNMIRIWGGGIYEEPVFYDLCDELGLMVWQDFMFANLDYPADDADFRAAAEQHMPERSFLATALASQLGASFLEDHAVSPRVQQLQNSPSRIFQRLDCRRVNPPRLWPCMVKSLLRMCGASG